MKKYITKQSNIKGAGKGLFTNASFKKGEVIGLAHVNGQPTKEVGSNHNHNENSDIRRQSFRLFSWLKAYRRSDRYSQTKPKNQIN